MPLRIHALFNLLLYALQLDISPSLYFILLFSPRLTPPDFSFFALPPLPTTFMWCFVGHCKFPPKLFLKQKRGTFRFCQRAFSSWRRSSRGNSQMMTAIVKGQISPCGFASDCMFISFWSGRDSKPLSRSPHSPNSWSSACHWNRLRADPGDRGKVAVCHPTSVLERKISFAVFSFFLSMSLTDQLPYTVCSTVQWLMNTHKLCCQLINIFHSKSNLRQLYCHKLYLLDFRAC